MDISLFDCNPCTASGHLLIWLQSLYNEWTSPYLVAIPVQRVDISLFGCNPVQRVDISLFGCNPCTMSGHLLIWLQSLYNKWTSPYHIWLQSLYNEWTSPYLVAIPVQRVDISLSFLVAIPVQRVDISLSYLVISEKFSKLHWMAG